MIYILHIKTSHILRCNVHRRFDTRPLALLSKLVYRLANRLAERLPGICKTSGIYLEKSSLVSPPCWRLPCSNMEFELPEKSAKTIVCFQHIKVEWLAGDTPESEHIPNLLPHSHMNVGRKTFFNIADKNQWRSPCSQICPLSFIPQDRNCPFHVPQFENLQLWNMNKVSVPSQRERQPVTFGGLSIPHEESRMCSELSFCAHTDQLIRFLYLKAGPLLLHGRRRACTQEQTHWKRRRKGGVNVKEDRLFCHIVMTIKKSPLFIWICLKKRGIRKLTDS